MRDYLKRLDRLESAAFPGGPIPRCVVQFIEAENGIAKPWAPRWASSYSGERIERQPDETPESFELRAKAEIPGLVLMGCGNA